MEPARADRPPFARAAAWLAPPWLAGAFLRLWGLPGQVLVGDEMHGLGVSLRLPLESILTTYRPADHCIPLAALYRVLADAGVGLSEVVLRLPSVLSGLTVLVAFPLLLARWVGGRRGIAWAGFFAWLLALSPGLTYYSRIARPYAVVALLAPVAALSFWRWWRGGRAGGAVLYVAGAALSAWFHLGTLAFVAAPLAYAAADLGVRRLRGEAPPGGRGAGSLAVVACALTAGVLAFLAPAWRSFERLVETKARAASPELEDLVGALLLEAGSVVDALALLFWAAAAAGAAWSLRRHRAAALYGAVVWLAQWVGMTVVLRPTLIDNPLVIHRYLLVTLPLVLLAVSAGLLAVWERSRSRAGGAGRWLAAAPVAMVGLLALAGPYVQDPWLRLGTWGGTNPAASWLLDPPRLPPELVPRVYHLIGGEPGGSAVIEAPSGLASHLQGPAVAFSRVHGRPVLLAVRLPWVEDPRLALRTVVAPRPEYLLREDGRFLVLHQDRPWFYRLVKRPERLRELGPTPEGHRSLIHARMLTTALRRSWGEPHLVEEGILVWDLAQVRARAEATARSPGP